MNRRARQDRITVWLLVCLLCGGAVAGCDGHPRVVPPPEDPEPSFSTEATRAVHGHYRGTVIIGDDQIYHAEAILTIDGTMRLYVGGPTDHGAAIQAGAGLFSLDDILDPDDSAMFVGDLETDGNTVFGTGLVIGQTCVAPDTNRFCDDAALAVISMTASGSALEGELRLVTTDGVETWLLNLGIHSAYYAAGESGGAGAADGVGDGVAYVGPAGTFEEKLAQFADADDVIVAIDDSGRIFFQSPASGCVGNGALTPHLNGQYYVFDVELLIESCDSNHAFLNGEFDGLATVTQDGYWDYDRWLLILLSTADGSAGPQAAVTMVSGGLFASQDPDPCIDCWDY